MDSLIAPRTDDRAWEGLAGPIPMPSPSPDTATGTTSRLDPGRPGSSVSVSSGITPEEAQMHLAKAIYASGCPLSMVDNKLWAKFFKTLRPFFKIRPGTQFQTSSWEGLPGVSATVKD
ncbi:hypothetical protein GWK47_009424 [Chionoecetes opilio]|uniref:Uncharacterized protein n=1 Tax=Chionoecetes opilio TaxID=41210 RepID=A0A8J4Y330_CHIOP|nr:hypothetical protein GWK47_009424 [Chionoecetes opilio]